MITTDSPESPGPSYTLDGVNIDEHGRVYFVWRRSCLRIVALCLTAVVVLLVAWRLVVY